MYFRKDFILFIIFSVLNLSLSIIPIRVSSCLYFLIILGCFFITRLSSMLHILGNFCTLEMERSQSIMFLRGVTGKTLNQLIRTSMCFEK